MAQPLFNEHPLQAYLRQSGDIFESMPGAMSDLPDPFSEEYADTDTDADLNLWSWLPTPPLHLVQFFDIVVASVQNHHSTLQEFSDKFQYDVISSSLLSSSVTAPSSTRRRSSSSTRDALDDLDLKSRTQPSRPIPGHSVEHRTSAWSLTLFGLCCISLLFDSFILCVLMGTALYYIESYAAQPGNLPDFISPTLGSLNDLISAANLWDSAVHEAINLLELEESMSPSSPSSPLRVALHSSLQSTQVQSDNVRHVLVGLTAPSALARLSEMYAPPSPLKPLATLHSRSGSATAGSRVRPSSPLASDKRATWNGSISYSYAALANAGSPSRRSLMRWEKRRSDLSALLLRPNGAAMSAPSTPVPGTSLNGVEEERGEAAASLSEQEGDAGAVVPLIERGQFASAALEFQRQRRSRGIEALYPSPLSPPPKYTAISPQPPTPTIITRLGKRSTSSQSPPPSSYSASRFTAIQMPRHPLSLHSLTLTLNGALAARRYAASHLLALRFGAGDAQEDSGRGGDSYWEDVRSVMALLTSALAHATAPLLEALEAAEHEHERLLTENPTPTHSRTSSESYTQSSPFHQQRLACRTSSSHAVTSFAPLPSHLARFAAHVDALTNALHDAREHLDSCVASLRDGTAATTTSPQDAPALRAYERLRRELGLALRECERGREPLLELLLPPRAPSPDDDDDDDEEDDEVPALGPDAESSDSDKAASHPSSPTHAVLVEARPPDHEDEEDEDEVAARERGRGVLVVGLERLPAPGIEQVFEADDAGADADAGPDADADADGPRLLARPRSKLSRADRIAAAKARRATTGGRGGLGLSVGERDGAEGMQWAPVGDVVQELKDVIWKVGEQRRMREQRQRGEGELDGAHPRTEDVFTCPTT